MEGVALQEENKKLSGYYKFNKAGIYDRPSKNPS